MSPLRIVFFGTPEIAVPTLERLLASRHPVVGVVSQPDRGRGRGRKESPSPVSEVALRAGIPLLRPEKVGDADCVEAMRAWRPDLGVVVAFGQFLPKAVRELPTKGYLINAHASLLPRHRGAAPIARAILEGDAETGISVMRIEKAMDAGPVAAVARIEVAPRENTAELSGRLGLLAADLIGEVVDAIAEDRVVWTEQDERQATHAAKIEKSDAILDLREGATALARRIHALAPRPGASLVLVQDGTSTELKLLRADALPFACGESPAPGTVDRNAPALPLRIATGDGWLVPLEIQRAGGKPLAIADFLRGFAVAADARCERSPEPA
ncbi:MAG: methionyl-tRNA formyltransferase [Myxococcota bacterium]